MTFKATSARLSLKQVPISKFEGSTKKYSYNRVSIQALKLGSSQFHLTPTGANHSLVVGRFFSQMCWLFSSLPVTVLLLADPKIQVYLFRLWRPSSPPPLTAMGSHPGTLSLQRCPSHHHLSTMGSRPSRPSPGRKALFSRTLSLHRRTFHHQIRGYGMGRRQGYPSLGCDTPSCRPPSTAEAFHHQLDWKRRGHDPYVEMGTRPKTMEGRKKKWEMGAPMSILLNLRIMIWELLWGRKKKSKVKSRTWCESSDAVALINKQAAFYLVDPLNPIKFQFLIWYRVASNWKTAHK